MKMETQMETQKRRNPCDQSKVIGESWIILFCLLTTESRERKVFDSKSASVFIQQLYQKSA